MAKVFSNRTILTQSLIARSRTSSGVDVIVILLLSTETCAIGELEQHIP